ncbi:lysozyme inhibitor LprI family protein [Sphingomonas sp. Leaf242]|uniref:lysozyme inhibitor LprI family protein n=1 Tax=Sphingomonas sp. Leaf242 TaxID=1736304 RepID=UPI00071461DD|nr:lysozyme inhibitor LprI family protein [Sphingomonas sp. Leaf242]KQO08354.1 hypothetical protein ASF09_10750 [Sphingomonas sp. Leaf242]
MIGVVAIVLAQVGGMPPNTCANPLDQSTMTRCAYEDYDKADAQLNAQWRRTLARRRDLDKANPMDGAPTYMAALTAAQRAWIAYRDAQCAVEGQEMRGGSGEPMIAGQCLARLTRERTAYLKRVEHE